jgi:hypothetical protein
MSRRDGETPRGVCEYKKSYQEVIHMFSYNPIFDDTTVATKLETLLRSKGHDVKYTGSTTNTFDFSVAGSYDDDFIVKLESSMFKFYEWTWVSEDWAEYVLVAIIPQTEVLA